MNFSEAMKKLKSGSKISRLHFNDDIFFVYEYNHVICYSPRKSQFGYDEDIMVSSDWYIDDSKKSYDFVDVIPALQAGKIAKLKDWKDLYIYFDHQEKCLILNSMEINRYQPSFSDFIANDWVEIK